jgi:predicted nucleic acid-binding protein
MVLADTSVWITHFRRTDPRFADELNRGSVLIHSVVIGELACGNLARRADTLSALGSLPRAVEADFDECLQFLELHHLAGRGLGWSDIQLLASAKLSHVALWSADRRLREASARLGVGFPPASSG